MNSIFQRQRSVSLSSLDGEVDLELDGKSRKISTNVGKWPCRSQASTHSLNEADFVQVTAFKFYFSYLSFASSLIFNKY